jgi:23S rRNA (cytosine1962-C5)-methyltransferase
MPKKPSPENLRPSVKLSARGAARIQSRHPWVYRSDIAEETNTTPGTTVRVYDHRGKFLGTALYSSSSQIAIRMISHGSVDDLPALISQRIRKAIAYRKEIVADTNAYRLVFSEADFLPGLIIDRYNDIFTVQILTQAMDATPVREAIVSTLAGELHPASILERVDARIRELENLPPLSSRLLAGDRSSIEIKMNGIAFHYDGLEGQKTGAFLDQRENYAAAAHYAHGEALDVFCYQGGFTIHLAPKCSSVTGIDSSRPALEAAEKNAALNFPGRELEWIEANAFDLLREYATTRQYDTIVLDPPAFAKTHRDLEKALRGYKELNLRAIKMLRPEGTLITCSCSFHVSQADFQQVVADAAQDAHKSLRIIEVRGAAKDHPVLLNVPETCYLKCMILSVSD